MNDLPHSARSVTDLEHGRIYLPPASIPGGHGLRSMALQAMAHRLLGHQRPTDYADFLEQRLEINYFAACALMPEAASVAFLTQAKRDRNLAVEDFRDAFGVTHEAAAMRMTNLLTRHLGIRLHFLRADGSGAISRVYENDDLPLPHDVTGSVEGQILCRKLVRRARRSRSTTARPSTTSTPTRRRARSGARPRPDRRRTGSSRSPSECPSTTRSGSADARRRSARSRRVPTSPAAGARRPRSRPRWQGKAWPSARVHMQMFSPLPRGAFPGVDDNEVYAFLDRHAEG